MKTYRIGEDILSIDSINEIISKDLKLVLSSDAKKKIRDCRNYLDKKIKNSDNPIYGINTGFGSLYNKKISNKDLNQLQTNLVLSHACGLGDEVPCELVKLIVLLKIQSLSYGHSGIQLNTVQRLIDMYNQKIYPVIYEQGSLGASGDLAPLAHMSLSLLGLGEVDVLETSKNGYYKRKTASKVLKDIGWDSLQLASKEGLALLNGTQFMSAYGVWVLVKAKKLSYLADLIAAISLEAFDCRSECYDHLIQAVRPHHGQIKTAENIREFLEGSKIQKIKKEHVQDPYSVRCIPQVHGATKDVISHVEGIFNTEINSVTDNPNIFEKEDQIISGGNFHGQVLAMGMDYLAIALSELGSISERRTYQLISGSRDLPSFLVSNPGVNSGMMITQYTAASIVSQNKQLCTPSSVDSIVSSNGQEDHVSMGANAATKLFRVVNNIEKILAIELMNATQALAYRKNLSSEFIENIIDLYRNDVKFLKKDRLLNKDLEKSISFLHYLKIDKELL
jgi:histidine ammonia-lyase